MTPIFFTLEQALAIHAYQIAHFGGAAGVRDLGLLQSALAAPQAAFGGQYLHADLYEMGATYVFHVVKNHAFVDANKRVGAAVAAGFIELNGLQFNADPDAYADLVLELARGKIGRPELIAFFRANAQ